MKFLLNTIFITCILLAGTTSHALAQNKDARTASARAAYGSNIPSFKSHAKKNNKKKKKASRAAKKTRSRNKEGYRRGVPI